jgi:hypothetical protein
LDLSNEQLERGRYRREAGKIVIDVAINNYVQLFNKQDPAPFRERDLDENFVTYVLNSVQEFPIKSKMKLEIFMSDEKDHTAVETVVQEAIRGYFKYESKLTGSKMRKRFRVSRWFFLIGLLVLFVCLNVAHLLETVTTASRVLSIAREGFVIIGWVAMWRPIEAILYDWWPLHEQKLYLEKIAKMDIEVKCGLYTDQSSTKDFKFPSVSSQD